MPDAAPTQDAAEPARYIGMRYHARHRERLTQLAARVEDGHFGDDHMPDGLADILRRRIGAIEVHMTKEELILLPAIRKDGGHDTGNWGRSRTSPPPARACAGWQTRRQPC